MICQECWSEKDIVKIGYDEFGYIYICQQCIDHEEKTYQEYLDGLKAEEDGTIDLTKFVNRNNPDKS